METPQYLKTWQEFSNALSYIEYWYRSAVDMQGQLQEKKNDFMALVAAEPYKSIFQNSAEMQAYKTKANDALNTITANLAAFYTAHQDIIDAYTPGG